MPGLMSKEIGERPGTTGPERALKHYHTTLGARS